MSPEHQMARQAPMCRRAHTAGSPPDPIENRRLIVNTPDFAKRLAARPASGASNARYPRYTRSSRPARSTTDHLEPKRNLPARLSFTDRPVHGDRLGAAEQSGATLPGIKIDKGENK
jgi:hypothetical protein